MLVSNCLIVRDEERDIAEWLAYQHVLGFDVVYVYDHMSTDRTAEIVRKVARHQDVRLISWDHPSSGRTQLISYQHCHENLGEGIDWCFFTDADEFFVPHGCDDVKTFLGRFADAAAVAVNWAVYGSDGHADLPSCLVIEAFRRRADPRSLTACHLAKSFVRPETAQRASFGHYSDVEGLYVDSAGRPVQWVKPGKTAFPPDYAGGQLNHYLTRSRAHWAKRLSRGQLTTHSRSWEDFERYDRNEILDESAIRFAPLVRRQLERYGLELEHVLA
ncbi:MAG: glycosyltransferase family 2 protein [Caulobacteraceae bacterium]